MYWKLMWTAIFKTVKDSEERNLKPRKQQKKLILWKGKLDAKVKNVEQ